MEEPLQEQVLDNGPDWRWNRVRRLASKGRKPSARICDSLIREGCRYLTRRYRLRDSEDQFWLHQDFPDLYDAHVMYENTDSERWIVEAGVLAGQPDDFLARYVASRPEVIRTYADYFYDIRDKLESDGYIINRLLRPAVMHGSSTYDPDFMLKMAAWADGWRGVQSMLDFRHLSVDGLAWLKVSFIHTLVKKGWLATQRVEVNNYTSMELINTVLRLAELEFNDRNAKAARREGQAQESEILAGLQVLLNTMQTGILRPEKVIGDEPRALAMLETNHGKDG